MIKRTLGGAFGLAALLGLAAPAGAVVTYTDPLAWGAAAGPVAVEDLGASGIETPLPTGVPAPVGTHGLAVTLSAGALPGAVGKESGGTYPPSPFPPGSGNHLYLHVGENGTLSDTAVITLPHAVTAFAADFGKVDHFDVAVTIAGSSFDIFDLLGVETGFVGFTSATPFTTVSFALGATPTGTGTGTPADEFFHLDNVAFSTPEPLTVALLGLGLAGLGWRRRG